MTKKIHQDIIRLYDQYTHTPLERREFLRRLAGLAGGTAAAYALLPLLENNYARAQTVTEDDERLSAGPVEFPGAGAVMLSGYMARPLGIRTLPGVLVIHENRGLNPYIRDVTRRLALGGYVALAPDMLSPEGGTPEDSDQAREMIGALDTQVTVAHLEAAVRFLEDLEDTTGDVGIVGFCWGGGMVNRLATRLPGLDAAVMFYGRNPDLERVPEIQAPLLLHYAGLDERINAGIPDYEAALQEANVDYTLHLYEGVNHAFHNDTNEARYDEQAAALAWERTMAFFDEHLKG